MHKNCNSQNSHNHYNNKYDLVNFCHISIETVTIERLKKVSPKL